MIPQIEALRKLAARKITKAKLQALQKSHADAEALFERLHPKPRDEDAAADFPDASSKLESALDRLSLALDELEIAEEKDERDDATSDAEDALRETVTAFDAIVPISTIASTTPPPASSSPDPGLDPDVANQLAAILNRPEQERDQAFAAWVQSAAPEQIAKVAQFLKRQQPNQSTTRPAPTHERETQPPSP